MHLLMLDSLADTVQSALEINLTQMLIQIAATIILIVVVRVFFWSKVTAFLEKRQQLMTEELDSAKVQNEEAKALKETAEKERKELLSHSKELFNQAKLQGENEKNKIISNAKEEARRLIESKEEELEMEKERARAELRSEVIDLAVKMAENVIKQEIDDKKYQSMSVDDFERSEEA